MAKLRDFEFLNTQQVQELPDLEWLVEGMLPDTSLAIIFGAPGCGKTFVALSMAMSIASGRSWVETQTIQKEVLYVAAEGVRGLKMRIAAVEQHFGQTVEKIRFMPGAFDIRDKRQVTAFINAIRKHSLNPGVIIIDTLARVTVGADENNAKDMGLAVEALDRLKTEFEATVVAIHHTRKGDGVERGSGTLRGAADLMIRCEESEHLQGKAVHLECSKIKDGEPFKARTIALEKVQLYNGQSSLVLGPIVEGIATEPADHGTKILNLLATEFSQDGATNTDLKMAFTRAGYGTENQFNKAMKKLRDTGKVRKEGEGKGARYFPMSPGSPTPK
ncbi:AAA family ATPase [Shimia aestuarii]|uniref:AAA family ATPase n=1 Tax=Shimia aestuarii TaxID=254406 RepID=UPI001FB48C5A|nr:AAA family ATPase [Shimia aestuarii]